MCRALGTYIRCMKAWVLTEHGDPTKGFALRDLEDPIPSSEQVLIEAEGFGLNYADVMASKGLYREAPPLPSVLGYEVVGRVKQLGASVPATMLGKRVVAFTRFGGYARLACTDHRAVAEIPEEMSVGVACALATQGCTAWYMATYAWPLREGMRVLVHSAAGGVGQLLVQLAVRAGCDVFAVASGPEKMTFLKDLGAKHTIDRRAGNSAEQIRSLLNGRKLHVSYNAVGGSSFKKDMELIGSGGAVVLFGGAERGRVSTLRFVWSMGLVLPIFLMMKSKSIIGVNMLKLSDHDPALLARCLHEVVRETRAGHLVPHVHQEYPASDLVDAHKALAGGRTMGKVALRW